MAETRNHFGQTSSTGEFLPAGTGDGQQLVRCLQLSFECCQGPVICYIRLSQTVPNIRVLWKRESGEAQTETGMKKTTYIEHGSWLAIVAADGPGTERGREIAEHVTCL